VGEPTIERTEEKRRGSEKESLKNGAATALGLVQRSGAEEKFIKPQHTIQRRPSRNKKAQP